MIDISWRFRLGAGVALIAGMTALAGCGATPETRTFTTQQTTTTTPPPPVMATTTTTTAQTEVPMMDTPDPPLRRHYARHRPVHSRDVVTSGSTVTDTDTTITAAQPSTTVMRKSTETTNTH
jgi:hypothetical protein